MEPHATTVVWEGDGKITVHDKIQGVQNTQGYIANVFGLTPDDVHVVSPFVGGAFGSGLRPQYQLFLAVMAALALKRSVRVELTRDQMFTFGYRPATINTVALGARRGRARCRRSSTTRSPARLAFEDYQEVVVNWSGLLYHCDNVAADLQARQARHLHAGDMRAPGAPLGHVRDRIRDGRAGLRAGVDPVELRLRNYAETRRERGQAVHQQGAARRLPAGRGALRLVEARSRRRARCARATSWSAGAWRPASGRRMMMQTARAPSLTADGTLEIASATADIGTGTYTILAQIAADTLGVPMDQVTVKLGDSSLPKAPVEGGSWTAASAGSAVQAGVPDRARDAARAARGHRGFAAGQCRHRARASSMTGGSCWQAIRRSCVSHRRRHGDGRAWSGSRRRRPPNRTSETRRTTRSYTHSAVFVEVRVDEELGVVRVTRVVDAVAAGQIINPKTARSQIIGGVVFGIGMALHEEAHDRSRARPVHEPQSRRVPRAGERRHPDIEVIFVDEHDDKTNPLGVKGLGEIGIVGTAAAVANAIYHATGKRVRDLPITIDKLT